MTRYLLRQLSLLVITLFLLTLVAFSLTEYRSAAGPGNGHMVVQYLHYLWQLVSGDWGVSLLDGSPVWDEVKVRFPATLELALVATLLALIGGIPAGVVAAIHIGEWPDKLVRALSLGGYSMPVFWLAQLVILIFAVNLPWFPIAGQINPLYDVAPRSGSILIDIALSPHPTTFEMYRNALSHMALPALVLSLMPASLLARLTRSAMLDVLRRNYIKSARAKGLSGTEVLFKHAVPNTMERVTRELGILFSLLITNTLITEVIFSWPGLGSWFIRSIYERDYPVMQAGLLILASLVLVMQVMLNILHGWRYPQVRQELYAQR